MKFLFLLLTLTLIGPLWLILNNKIDFTADWRTANRASIYTFLVRKS